MEITIVASYRCRNVCYNRKQQPPARQNERTVFIHGNMPEKTQRIIRLYNVDEKKAVKMMADTDKRRMTNYNFYTEHKWGKASNYTLCLNSSQLGYDRCEKIIMECIK